VFVLPRCPSALAKTLTKTDLFSYFFYFKSLLPLAYDSAGMPCGLSAPAKIDVRTVDLLRAIPFLTKPFPPPYDSAEMPRGFSRP
jgi:hypothetical protein